MAELMTRLVLRNDSTANWLANESKVLLKGEVGIEFLADGKVKMKVGDGTKTWAELDYFGGEVLVGDDNSIVVDGTTVKLNGFADAEVGAHLVKGEDGSISWEVPSVSVEEVDEKLGEIPEGKTIIQLIEESKYDDSALVDKVAAIEADYLKASDKDELTDAIATAKQEAIETILGEAVDEKFDTLKEVAEWIQSDTTASASLITRITNAETKLTGIEEGAQVNKIETVDETQFAINDKNLTLLDIAMGKVTGLTDALAGKVDKVEGSRLMTAAEAEKLEKLVINTEDGSVEVSGTIAAANVSGLDEWIANRAATHKGLSENNLSDTLLAKLNGIAEGAEVNYVKSVSNELVVSAAGELSVGTVNVNKLVQTEGEYLVMNGGSAAI